VPLVQACEEMIARTEVHKFTIQQLEEHAKWMAKEAIIRNRFICKFERQTAKWSEDRASIEVRTDVVEEAVR
jgi:hypothetical protein